MMVGPAMDRAVAEAMEWTIVDLGKGPIGGKVWKDPAEGPMHDWPPHFSTRDADAVDHVLPYLRTHGPSFMIHFSSRGVTVARAPIVIHSFAKEAALAEALCRFLLEPSGHCS